MILGGRVGGFISLIERFAAQVVLRLRSICFSSELNTLANWNEAVQTRSQKLIFNLQNLQMQKIKYLSNYSV